jgi:hypothetical protein
MGDRKVGDTRICGSVCTEYVLAARVERKSWRDGDVPGRLLVTCKCWALDEGHAEIQKYKKEQTSGQCNGKDHAMLQQRSFEVSTRD